MEHHRQVHHIHKSRAFRRFGSIIAVGLLSAGLAGLPSITGADGGNGNGGDGGNGHGGGNGNAAGSNGNGNGAADQAMICHIPPGNPANSHTIEVGEPAVPAHLAHGDSLGACGTATTTTEASTTTTTEASTTTTTEASTTTTTTTEASTSTTVVLVPAIAVSYTPSGNALFCNVVVDLTDFGPSQTYEVTLAQNGNYGVHPDSPWTFDVNTDVTGAAQLTPFTYYQGDDENAVFNATADGINSGDVNVSC